MVHEHVWVRLASCQLFGILFANFSVDDFFSNQSSFFNHVTDENKFLKIRDLIDNLCSQLKAPVLENELAEQIIKNLAYLAKFLKKYEFKMDKTTAATATVRKQAADEEADEESEEEDEEAEKTVELKHNIDLEWLIRKVTREAKYEMVNKPKETTKRTCIFKLLAAISLELGENVKNYLGVIIPCLHREIVIGQTGKRGHQVKASVWILSN